MLDFALQGAGGMEAGAIAAGEKIAEQIGASEWLGPLAPVALSPFFGLATLSGIATYGPDWLQQRSALFSEASGLNSPLLFWTLAILALLTSLPRFSKVSKPVALAAEKLETYSAVIILFAVRMLGQSSGEAMGQEQALASVSLSAGITTIPLDILMSIAAGLSVIVINAVKLFLEFLVWLIPVPLVDAAIEVLNKVICAGLMSLYCFSPALAAALDIILLILCAMVFGWIYRRLRFYRELIAGPALAWLLPGWFGQRSNEMIAFLDESYQGVPKCWRVSVVQVAVDEYVVRGSRWFRRFEWRLKPCTANREEGLLIQRLHLESPSGSIRLSHRRWVAGDAQYVGGSSALVSG